MMRRFKIISLVCCLFVTIAWAQDQFNLSGTIKNQADFQVIGLVCELVEAGHVDTTDSSGAFNVIGDATSIVSLIKKEAPTPQFKGSQIFIPVTSGIQPVSVEVYNLKGSKIATVFNKMLPEGEHTIPFANRMNTVSQSVLIAVVKRGSDISKFRLINAGSRGFMVQKMGSGMSGNSQTLATASHPIQLLDSLRFKRCIEVEGQQEEFIEFTIPIANLEDEFEVTLDLIPYEAIEWGKTQEDRDDYAVGKELKEQNIYPYDLEKYNSQGSSWAWCSEFYCYCMRIGGCPLGDDGGTETNPNWMLWGWNTLITWFEDNAVYIEKSEIDAQNYLPNPGDFVQMSEHTTMVRYIEDDGTLHTLGGNEGDKVNLATRGNYKTFSSLNGYGRRSGITGNSFISVR